LRFFLLFPAAVRKFQKRRIWRAFRGGGRGKRYLPTFIQFLLAGRLQKMSNFIWLALPAGRQVSLRLRLLRRGASTPASPAGRRRASETAGSKRQNQNWFCLKEKRKNFKELFINSNGATRWCQQELRLTVRLRH